MRKVGRRVRRIVNKTVKRRDSGGHGHTHRGWSQSVCFLPFMCVYMCPNRCIGGQRKSGIVPWVPPTFCGEIGQTGSLTGLKLTKDPRLLASKVLGSHMFPLSFQFWDYSHVSAWLGFYVSWAIFFLNELWGTHLGPCVCKASTLPTERSPLPQGWGSPKGFKENTSRIRLYSFKRSLFQVERGLLMLTQWKWQSVGTDDTILARSPMSYFPWSIHFSDEHIMAGEFCLFSKMDAWVRYGGT